MNSTISEDLSRENLAFEAAKCTQNIFSNNQNLALLHKELLEINLSITAYIEESKRRLGGLRLDLANEAKDSYSVVEILSNKCEYFAITMSQSTSTPRQHNTRATKNVKEDNNNSNNNKTRDRQQAKNFISWYKQMVDNERQNLALYLSDDAILEWFGRTIKSRKKVSSFLKHDMQCSRHDFVTVQSIEKIQSRQERLSSFRKVDKTVTSLLHSPEMVRNKTDRKRRILRSNCNSPEWAEGCQPVDEVKESEDRKTDNKRNKRLKVNLIEAYDVESTHEDYQKNGVKRSFETDESIDVNSKGDGLLGKRVKRKLVPVTPPNQEVGQGDCLPSTSADSDKSHDALNAQLPKLFVECNGYIEFCRTKNNRSSESDTMKWERKCKVQISYSEDPLNVGEYIIWALHYTDESKCRRNLLPAFEEVAREEEEKGLK